MTTQSPHERLATLGLSLPRLGSPAYSYTPATQHQGVLYLSGQISRLEDGTVLAGHVGVDATVAEGQAAAQVAALSLLARIEEAVGLAQVRQVLKLNVWVASGPDFYDQPAVAEGASRLLVETLGDAGRHARTALPAPGLPKRSLVELDAVVAVSG